MSVLNISSKLNLNVGARILLFVSHHHRNVMMFEMRDDCTNSRRIWNYFMQKNLGNEFSFRLVLLKKPNLNCFLCFFSIHFFLFFFLLVQEIWIFHDVLLLVVAIEKSSPMLVVFTKKKSSFKLDFMIIWLNYHNLDVFRFVFMVRGSQG